MSAIAGIYHSEGSPIDGDLLQRMGDVVATRGPDGAGIWVRGKVGFAHRLLYTTEESIHERQPLANSRGLWVTADCRIDNRDELKKIFQSKGIWRQVEEESYPFDPPDGAYVLLSYELWGEEAPHHLLGAFAFAIWDERKQRLFCARDPIGIKPFLYHWSGKRFLFGSEMKQIFQDGSLSMDLNIPHLAEVLIRSSSSREETPYQAIRRLPPGNLLRIQAGNLELRRYWRWHPDEAPQSRASVQENAEVFLDLFREAVRSRLRVPTGCRVGSMLSGGLDSSSITAVAASFQGGGGAKGTSPFPVFTMLFPEADPSYRLRGMDPVDERSYSDSLVQRYSLEFHPVEIKGWGPFENLEETLWRQEGPKFFPNLASFSHLFATARGAGVSALLCGEGGDELFRVGSRCFLEPLRKGQFSKFYSLRLAGRTQRVKTYLNLFNSIFRTFLPDWLKVPYRRFIRNPVPHWINPAFARRISLRERAVKDFRWDPHSHGSSSRGILNWLFSGLGVSYLETMDRAAPAHVEIRFPFLDVRILRFMATVPWDQKVSGASSKVLLRRALKDFLPMPILGRAGKTEFTPVVRTALERYASRQLKEAFENPHPILRMMTLPDEVRTLYANYFYPKRPHTSLESTESLWFLWYLAIVDQWLKHQAGFVRKLKEVRHEKQEQFVLSKKQS